MPTVSPKSPSSLLSSPAYQRIEESLRRRVRDGDWPVGTALPGRRTLAKEYNVAIGTVQRAIANLLADGILQADGPQGTFVAETAPQLEADLLSAPSRPARPLRGGLAEAPRTNAVASLRIGVILGGKTLIAPDEETAVSNLFFGPLLAGIRDGLMGTGVDISYVQGDGDDYESIYHDGPTDGLIIVAPLSEELPALRRLAIERIPFVAVAISSPFDSPDTELPCVDTDNRQGAYQAVRHLIELGHRKIALVNLAGTHANHHDRFQGYLQALSEAGAQVTPDHLVLHARYDEPVFASFVDEWFTRVQASGNLPTAIFACDYVMALTALGVLRKHGVRVPEDISLVGFDDNISAAHLSPPLTTVRVPVQQMGRRSATRLLEYLQDPTGAARLHGTEKLPNQLIIRASTCPPICQATPV